MDKSYAKISVLIKLRTEKCLSAHSTYSSITCSNECTTYLDACMCNGKSIAYRIGMFVSFIPHFISNKSMRIEKCLISFSANIVDGIGAACCSSTY